ncbi:MAG: DUF4198 domain-containing protein [Oceanipulchritudo sp.]
MQPSSGNTRHKRRFHPLLVLLLAVIPGTPLAAHEFWIEPMTYRLDPGDRLEAHVVNGENFKGPKVPYAPRHFIRFEQVSGERSRPVRGRPGQTPALRERPLDEGLLILVYTSRPDRADYATFEELLAFAEHKDFAGFEKRHRARDLPTTEIGEVYTRYAKSLVAVGTGSGEDRHLDLETELVALANPYTDELGDTLPVKAFYAGSPRPNARVELFEKAPDGRVSVTRHRTDASGVAHLPVKPGHAYLADAVVLREPGPELARSHDAAWETLWASLTFSVPE